jgi:galactose mutarotase-like enzyme
MPPAVEQLRFSDGTIELVVLPEVGARLHRLRAFGHDLLRTPDDLDAHVRDPFFWGAYVMAPWCNRIEAGPVLLGSRRIAVGSNFPDGSAIHGQVYARPWDRRDDGTLHVRGGGDGWPWAYEVGLRIEVVDPSVRIELSLVNASEDPMPAGLGVHPWFRRPVLVAIRGDAVYPENAATRPWPEPVLGPFDLREVGAMPADLDATWTHLAEPPVELHWPEVGVRATMRARAWVDGPAGPGPVAPGSVAPGSASPTIYVVAASPGNLDAVAVEPETNAPQGLRRLLRGEPGGLLMLGAGEALGLRVDLAFERLED